MSDNEKKDTEVQETKTETAAPDAVKSVETADDEKRMGIKEVVSNPDAIAIEKGKAEETVPGKEALPSFFVDKSNKHRVEVDILSSKDDGKIMSVSRTGLGLDFKEFDYLRHTKVWFEFTVPTYEDMSTYRTRCASFRKEVGQMLVDRLQLRNYILIWHLKDWSLTDGEGNKVQLSFDNDASLEDASVKKVYSLHPTIIDVVLTIFEKDILLT